MYCKGHMQLTLVRPRYSEHYQWCIALLAAQVSSSWYREGHCTCRRNIMSLWHHCDSSSHHVVTPWCFKIWCRHWQYNKHLQKYCHLGWGVCVGCGLEMKLLLTINFFLCYKYPLGSMSKFQWGHSLVGSIPVFHILWLLFSPGHTIKPRVTICLSDP